MTVHSTHVGNTFGRRRPRTRSREVSLLARASRINLRCPVQAFFDDLFSNPAYHPFDLTSAQVYLADELRFTRDPFDALIVAAARTLALPLVTRDRDLRASGAVHVIW